MTPNQTRLKLKQDLFDRGVDLKEASLAIKRNHAYLQQFIERGKPVYLPEPARERLARLYHIDVSGLKPPIDLPIVPGVPSARPRVGDPIQDAREADIVYTWRQLPEEDKEFVVGMLDGIRRRRGENPSSPPT